MENTTKNIGDNAEKLAEKYLLKKGIEILATNYRYRRCEVDIIGKENGLLIFYEVKFRSNLKFGNPEDFIDQNKINRLLELADHYIFKIDWLGDFRIDGLCVTKNQQITHFKDLN